MLLRSSLTCFPIRFGRDKLSLVERCLLAGKHVLVDDPITSDMNEYCRLVNLAHESKRHLQDTTMFIHHHAVREFLECVLNKDEFGEITKVNTCFDINPDDPRYRGILVDPKKFVNKDRRGCIATLCRYCAVLGILIFQRSGRRALTAQVTNIELDDCGHPAHCICKIKFEGVGRFLGGWECDQYSEMTHLWLTAISGRRVDYRLQLH